MLSYTNELSLVASQWVGTLRDPLLYQGQVSCAQPGGNSQRGYLREPLKRQAAKSPGRPGRSFRRSITKYRTNCRQSRSAQLP